MEIIESGMTFILEDNNCFHIEKHALGKTNCKRSTRNNKVCEFITFAHNRHVFVEAKSSAPKGPSGNVADLQLNGNPMPDNWRAFDNYTTYLHDIAQKFIDSFHILQAIAVGRHGATIVNLLDNQLIIRCICRGFQICACCISFQRCNQLSLLPAGARFQS